MARFIILLLLCVILVQATGAQWANATRSVHGASNSLYHAISQAYKDWETYKGMHPTKRYANESEENEHMLAFLRNLQMAEYHNEAFSRREVSFELDAWNSLSDLPFAKYMKRNGYRPRLYDGARVKNSSVFLPPMNVGPLPAWVDWRDNGYVTDVMDQGDCGSCWAISAVGSLEGQHKRATGVLVALSAQNLLDCTNNEKYGNAGCHGGWMDAAFQYVSDNKGVDKEFYYPYDGIDGERCMFNKMTIGAVDTGFVDLKMGDEEVLKVAVATQGPISVTIDAGHHSFALYKTGVYYEKECSSTALNHAVLVVGYGTDRQHGDYWIVKNSWGNDWGEAGYIRMSRNKNNQCGIATKASYPLV